MSSLFKKKVYCHHIINPPKERRGSDIKLILTGSNNLAISRMESESHLDRSFATPYLMEIRDPMSVGFTRGNESEGFRNLLMSFNILLDRVCVLDTNTSFTGYEVVYDVPGVIQDDVFVEIGIRESIDEKQIIDLFNKLQKFRRFKLNSNSTKQEVNLSLALLEYEYSMSSFDIESIFKHLFNSLEYSTNIDGKNPVGGFDSLYNSIVMVSKSAITDWRGLYNRVKHSQGSQQDVNKYFSGRQKISEYVSELRRSCRDMMLRRL